MVGEFQSLTYTVLECYRLSDTLLHFYSESTLNCSIFGLSFNLLTNIFREHQLNPSLLQFGMIDGDDTRKGIFPKNFIRPYEGSR